MQPNDIKQQPADYLDRIAPKSLPKKGSFYKRPIIIGSIGLIIIMMIVLIIGVMRGGINSTEKLAARLITTESTADGATSKIKSTQLRALNSELKIYLTNTIRDIEPILTKENVKINKLDEKVTASESSDKMLANLEDARLNAIYDRTYAREMAYQLDTVLTLMHQISSKTRNKDLQNFLENSQTNLEPTQKQFADFNAANS